MKKASKSNYGTSQECRCQRSACLKNYCRCYNANRMCGASCKCIGCKNVPAGSRPAPTPIKTEVDTRQKSFNDEIACSITKVLIAKAFQLQSEGVSYVQIEREVLLEFSSCLTEVAQQSQTPNL